MLLMDSRANTAPHAFMDKQYTILKWTAHHALIMDSRANTAYYASRNGRTEKEGEIESERGQERESERERERGRERERESERERERSEMTYLSRRGTKLQHGLKPHVPKYTVVSTLTTQSRKR